MIVCAAMSSSNPIICTFFLRDGYCSKGSYCSFCHDKSKQSICKYYSEGKCKHGNACSFLHSNKAGGKKGSGETSASRPAPPPIAQAPVSVVTTAATAATAAVATAATDDAVPHALSSTSTATIESLWGFGGADREEEGVYFYGAPGTTKFQPVQLTQLPAGSYSKVLASNLADDCHEEKMVADRLPVVPRVQQVARKLRQTVCQFYAAGNCKFGSACRHEHVADQKDAHGEEEDAGERKDCGICLAPPDGGGLYGLMSHCTCVFCLKCIRNWRSDGITVAHKSEQVRMCPLCRMESHFVIPSIRVVDGEKKEQVVASYKQSLAARPCMHYQQDGTCPFGSSCFYKHVNRDGSIDEPAGPRIIIKEDSTTEICPTTKLSDFLRTAKRR